MRPAPVGDAMAPIAVEIDEDRAALLAVARRLGVRRSRLKEGLGRLTARTAALTLSGRAAGDRNLGIFLQLEALSLGIEGKRCLWESLGQAAGDLAGIDASRLARRAERQRAVVEVYRLEWGLAALGVAACPGESEVRRPRTS